MPRSKYSLNPFNFIPPQILANLIAKSLGGHQLDVLRSKVNASIVKGAFISSRTVISSLTYKGLGSNLFRSTLSTAIPGKLFEETYNQTSSSILATSATLGFSTLNALIIETKFVTQTPTFQSLEYGQVLSNSWGALGITYALREAPYLVALVGLSNNMSGVEKVMVTSFLAAISFFPDAASRGILNMHLNNTLPKTVIEQFKLPIYQMVKDCHKNGVKRMLPGILIRTVSISLFVYWYTFCLDQINCLKSN